MIRYYVFCGVCVLACYCAYRLGFDEGYKSHYEYDGVCVDDHFFKAKSLHYVGPVEKTAWYGSGQKRYQYYFRVGIGEVMFDVESFDGRDIALRRSGFLKVWAGW